MDDLRDDPQEVADDIIRQAKKGGFQQQATNRIVDILTSYHQLRKTTAELAERLQTDSGVFCDGYLAWREIEGQTDGPFCALCYNGYKGLFRLVERKGTSWWECPSCGKHVQESACQEEQEELSRARDCLQIYLKEKLKRLSYDRVRAKVDESYTDAFLDKLIEKYPKVFRSCEIKTRLGIKPGITLTQEASKDT